MKYTFTTLLALSSTALAAYEPETVGNSSIYLDNPEVVTEYNGYYNYTASIDKNNGGGFLTTRDYMGKSTSVPAQNNLNSSYVEFSATLTEADVTCNKPEHEHEYGCDVFQAVYCYKTKENPEAISKLVYGINVVNNFWSMTMFDVTNSVAGEVKRNLGTVTGSAYNADSANATYRFISRENGIEFTRNGETLLSYKSPVPNPNVVQPLGPTYPSITTNTYFDCLNVTLGAYEQSPEDNTPYMGAETKEYDFILSNHAGYLMWRPIDGEITDGSLPAMAAYLMTYEAPPMVPEPTTATLSLLALVGLAARRRRK